MDEHTAHKLRGYVLDEAADKKRVRLFNRLDCSDHMADYILDRWDVDDMTDGDVEELIERVTDEWSR